MYFNDEIFINREMTRLVQTDTETNEPIIEHAMIKTNDLFENLSKKLGFETEILPSNCKYVKSYSDGRTIMVLEDEPQIRTISFNINPSTTLEFLKISGKYDLYDLKNFKVTTPYKLTLSFPYIVYIMNLDKNNYLSKMNVFFRLHPITGLGDYLLKPCLPNIDNSYKICLGDNKFNTKNYPSLIDTTQLAINIFWFNHFNTDYFTHVNDYSKVPELSDFFTWAYYTHKDPMFIFSVNWLPCEKYSTLKDAIYDNIFESEVDPISYLKKLIQYDRQEIQGENQKVNLTRCFSESFTLHGDNNQTLILGIGDEIKFKNKNYYIESLISDSYNTTGMNLENDEEQVVVKFNDYIDRNELMKNIKVNNPTSIKIGENIINTGDLIKFEDSGNIKFVEKIIKTADNMHQLKIGKYFYLDSCFLKNNLTKITEVEYSGITLEKGTEYLIHNFENNYLIFGSCLKYKFEGFETDQKRNELLLIFSKGSGIYKISQSSTTHKIISEDNLSVPPIYRISTNLYTNNYSNPEKTILLQKDNGVLIQNDSSYLRDEYEVHVTYQKESLVKFLKRVCKSTNFTIPSYDHDLTYSLGNEVIFIDWNDPKSMYDIYFITEFSMDNNYFYLTLKNSITSEEKKIPFINLDSGVGNFSSIRKVCTEINGLKVGYRVKAASKIYDFPMKDCNEIKAFVIDDIEPLVLFSNFRTLPVRTVMDGFKIFVPGTKEFSKTKISEPNPKIKIQDGDLFKISENNESFDGKVVCFVGSMHNTNKMKYVNLINVKRAYRAYANDYNPRYHSFAKDKNRYGLLLPRFSDSMMKELPYREGFPTIFSTILITKESTYMTIRRDWRGEY
jgi:hypothetical protein